MGSERFTGTDVPVLDFDVNGVAPIGAHWREIDDLQREHDFFWTTYAQGHWVLTDPEAIREAFRTPELFSCNSAVAAEPNPGYRWIPANLDPPEHAKYRRVLNPWFTRGATDALAPDMRRFCERIVDTFVDRGRCEFMNDFAALFPTAVFLHTLGLPTEDTKQFRDWVNGIFDNLRHPDRKDDLLAAMGGVQAYFAGVLADRRARPRDPEQDFITFLTRSSVDDKALGDEEILSICVILMIAGLHTTQGQLGYMFHFLAGHPEHRRRIREDERVIPAAVAEFLRVHTIVLPGRKVTRDVDFHGCPMKASDMVMLTIPAANRSPKSVSNPTEVDFDRRPNPQIAFGYGIHRCLGATFAEGEMATALRIWHEKIPDYRIEGDGELTESGGQLAPIELRLAWDPA